MENKEFQTLIFSLLFHGLLAWLLWHTQGNWQLPTGQDKPVEITVIDSDRTKMKHTPKNNEIPPDLLEKKLHDQAKILAQLEQRVKEQVIARKKTGETQNLGTSNAPLKPGQRKQNLDDLNPFKQPDRVAGLGRPREHPTSPQMLMGSSGVGRFRAIGDSTSGVMIPGVKEGSFTALNTDQLTYYSFYSRVNEAIVHRWVSNVRDYFYMLPPAMQMQLARSPNTTMLEIVLNSKGEFQQAIVHKSSGDTNLDSAALRPFKDAAPFLNPPAEMAGPDGKIRLLYQFTLTAY